ncbi:Outer membrane protein assembly factor BamB [Streptomyces tanashiensis]
MIERRRGGGRQLPGPVTPPRPPADPPGPRRDPRFPERARSRRPSAAGTPGPAESAGGPVRLGGATVPIGPGPRVADTRAALAVGRGADAGPATGWIRPPGGGQSAAEQAPQHRLPSGVRAPAGHRPGGTAAPAGARPLAALALPDVERRLGHPGRRRRPAVRDLLRGARPGHGERKRAFQDPGRGLVDGRRLGQIHASDGPTLYALDATDGSERWRLHTDAWVYSLQVDRGTVVTGTRGGGVQGWEASNGAKLWEITGAQTDFETPEAGPAVHGDTVYVWRDARLQALDARTGVERWSYPIGDAASCANVPVRVAPADGCVYVSAGTRVLSIDIAAGHVRWHFEAPAVFLSPPAFAPGPAVTGGGVYLSDHLGTVYALDATTGQDRWRIATEPRQSTEPVLVADGNVHVGSGSALYTLDAVTGTPRWRFAAGGELVGSPVVADGRVHFGSADHVLYTLDATGGQLRWKLATGGEITGSPVAKGGVVYACSEDRCVYALDAVKGTATGRGAAARPLSTCGPAVPGLAPGRRVLPFRVRCRWAGRRYEGPGVAVRVRGGVQVRGPGGVRGLGRTGRPLRRSGRRLRCRTGVPVRPVHPVGMAAARHDECAEEQQDPAAEGVRDAVAEPGAVGADREAALRLAKPTIHRIVKPRTTSPAKATSRRERSRTPTRVTRAAKAKGSRIEPRRSAFASVMPVNSSSTA